MTDIDQTHLNSFYGQVPDRGVRTGKEMVDFFAYFLQVELGLDSVRTLDIQECFRLADLPVPNWVAAYFTNSTKAKPPGYVKAKLGYRLHAARRESVSKELGNNPIFTQTSTPLNNILNKVAESIQRDFLKEAIDCYSAGCNRAAIVLFWSFILDHLFRLVLSDHISEFNQKLSNHPDKKINGLIISKRDDFSELSEVKFIEILRSCGIISNDVRKILDQKLGIRNSAAHPSTVIFKQAKANEFFDDLVDNVYLKYPLK